MSNPLLDLVAFLTANTGDYNALGAAKYVILLYFYALMVCSVILFVINLRQDRAQRSGTLLWLWAIRVLIGCMWFQGMLWKLPFGTQNGLYYWTQQMAGRAAFPQLAQFVRRRDPAELRRCSTPWSSWPNSASPPPSSSGSSCGSRGSAAWSCA